MGSVYNHTYTSTCIPVPLLHPDPCPHRVQERLGRGEVCAATTRVLHFVHNPEAAAEREAADARLAELEAQNSALKDAMQQLEVGY